MFNSDVDELVKKAIYELQVDSRDEFYIFLSKKVIPDVMNLAQYSGKVALKKYAELLQNEYSINSEFSELVIKRFIKHLVPKILMDSEPSQDENVNNNNAGLSTSTRPGESSSFALKSSHKLYTRTRQHRSHAA